MASEIIVKAQKEAEAAGLCPECLAEHCVFNPDGFCRLAFVTGTEPRLSDDGCEDYVLKDEA
jgi:hypothetical protein